MNEEANITNEIGPPTSEPVAEAAPPANYFEDIPPAPTPPAAETEKAKRARAFPPIHICRVVDGAFVPVKDAPEFNEKRNADAWLLANGVQGTTYLQARYDVAQKLRTSFEEVAV